MNDHEFYSEKIDKPVLAFGKGKKSTSQIYGLKEGGPYDVSLISKPVFNVLFLHPYNESDLAKKFKSKFTDGDYPFGGFSELFKKRIDIFLDRIKLERKEFEKKIKEVIESGQERIDIVFILLPKGKYKYFYHKGKLLLCSNGIPTQYIDTEKMKDTIRKGYLGYYLRNFSLNVYAKIGHKPWVLHRPESSGSDIMLGLGGTRVKNKNFFAFATLFERDGAFDWWSADMPKNPEDDDEFVSLLKNQIKTAINEYERENPDQSVDKIGFHISGKKPGKLERQAVYSAMKESKKEFKYTILHINTSSPLWVMDEDNSDKFYHLSEGSKIKLTSKDYLLVTGEPGDNPRAPIQPTRVEVVDHNFVSEDFENVHTMVEEVYQLIGMNWKGFNPKREPASIRYPHLIANFLKKFEKYGKKEEISSLHSNPSIRRKAWFL